MKQSRAIGWQCPYCGEAVIQEFDETWTTQALKDAFREKADSHIDFHVDGLMDEIREALSG